MRKKVKKRLLSLLLCGTMVFLLCPPAAAATLVNNAEKRINTLDSGERNVIPTSSNADRNSVNNGGIGKKIPVITSSKKTAEDVQKLIDALANVDEITEDNLDDVLEQIEALEALFEELTDEEYAKLDLNHYEKAVEALEALNEPVMLASNSVEYNGPEVVLGTEQIQSGSYLYFGHDGDSAPSTWDTVKWRVLDNEDNERLFLLMDNLLIDTDGGLAPFSYPDKADSSWANSLIRISLPEIEKDPVFIEEEEYSIIAQTYNTDTETLDRMFLLSREEADNVNYFPNGDSDRKASSNQNWWLRSPGDGGNGYVAYVNPKGEVVSNGMLSTSEAAIRPAMKINLDSVLFTIDADMVIDDILPENLGNLRKIESRSVDAWRLAIRDNAAKFNAKLVGNTGTVKPGEKITIDYSGTFPTTYIYNGRWVSAILADSDGNAMYYGQLASYNFADNKDQIEFAIPADLEAGDYTLKVFHERFSFGTDAVRVSSYASDFVDIPLTVTEESTEATLAAPDNAEWDLNSVGKATWGPVEGAMGYEVQLYSHGPKDKTPVGAPVIVEGGSNTECILPIDHLLVAYSFGVKALGGETYQFVSAETASNSMIFNSVNVEYVDVHFDVKGGQPDPIATQHVKIGSKLKDPGTPTKSGYIFEGWVYVPGTLWNFDDPVMSSMTLVAAWEPISSSIAAPSNVKWDAITVGKATWDAVAGASEYEVQLYTHGPNKRSPMGDPVIVKGTSYTFSISNTQYSYSFGVKALDSNDVASTEAFSNPKGFNRVNVDTVTVKYNTNGGIPSPLATVVVKVGNKVPYPGDLVKPGYKFMGWSYNPSTMWDFDDPVMTDMTLEAVWEPIESPSKDTSVSSVTVDGTKGTISGTKISVVLPRGSKIPTSASAVKITTKDDGALVMDLKTNNSGKTWTFTVMAEDGTTTEDYTITVTVKSSSSGGSSGGGGGSSSGGGGASSSSRRPSSTSSTKKPSLPAYVVSGTWSQNGEGQWRFTDGSGTIYKGRWAAVENPYANAALGQSGYDWFRFDADGNMVTGWFQDSDGNWYYLNPNSDGTRGRMLTGWFQDVDGSWYYLNPNSDGTRGRMMTGWNWIKDGDGVTRCYYLNPNADGTRGKMAVNTTVENYTLDAEGHWIVDGVIQTR